MGCGLVFDGDIDLKGVAGGDSYWFEALSGAKFGQPLPVESIIASLLRDGSIVTTTRYDNREASFPVVVRGADSAALADGERRLALACGKPTTLAYTPADGYGPSTVFKVLTSYLEQPDATYDDLAELRNRRTYLLRLVCEPFTRSVDKIIDSAGTPPSSGGSVVYAVESTTGWSKYAYVGGAAAVVDSTTFAQGTGSIRVEAGMGSSLAVDANGDPLSHGANTDQVSGLSISTGTGGYLSVKIRTEFTGTTYDNYGKRLDSGLTELSQQIGGAWVPVTAFTSVDTDANGWTRYVWPVAASQTVTGFRFYVQQYKYGNGWGIPDVWYDDVELLPSATTDHQIVKTLEVKGSARAPGSLHIAASSDSVALGQVLAITVSAVKVRTGFQPDVRRWVVSGATAADATALHGSYYSLGGAYSASPVFEVPVTMLEPGPYSIVALAASAALPMTVGVEAQLVVGGTTVGPTSEASATVKVSSGWQMMSLGTVYLPPVPMMNADASAKVRLRFNGGAHLADAFMVPLDADFSVVDCGTGTVSGSAASSHLWLDSPDPQQPQGGWWRGPVAERGLARSAWPDVKKPAQHAFEPGDMLAFLVSTGAQGPTLTLEYFPHWQNHAAL